ncbi:putative transferase CAF17 homolog, mitochondrial [Rhopilema esculentum]|uniref:putative transferase CAF17 homolog, mitochondrial n=1 Tax=Rhopilema esculentum TaxID=499914 RepID=UPI0031DC72AB|eukprot:gene15391-6628_t
MASLFRPRGRSQLSYCISFLRHYAQTKIRKPSLPKLVKLDDRRVIRIKGQDSAKFLQGMITNDLAQLENEDSNIMFSMFLNSQGRVLYDALLYSVPNENSEYFLEVGSAAVEGIVKVLKMYKLRAKVEFVDASSEVDVWAMFSESGLIETDIQSDQKIVAYKDPRLDALGIRMLVPWNQSPVDLLNIGPHISVGPAVYDEHRYKLGVAEGIDEIPQGNALPLEYNLAWINGVNFSKGCYIGQELTARTQHVGQIRKRIMPIQLLPQEKIKEYPQLAPQTPVKTDTGKGAGKICVMTGQYGLGLLRIKEVSESKSLVVSDLNGNEVYLTASAPYWWPSQR